MALPRITAVFPTIDMDCSELLLSVTSAPGLCSRYITAPCGCAFLLYFTFTPKFALTPLCRSTPAPDGLLAAILNHDPHDATIRVVALEGSRLEMAERTISLPGVKQLNGVVWAAGGQGWFVAAVTQMGSLFLYADGQGHTRVLRVL